MLPTGRCGHLTAACGHLATACGHLVTACGHLTAACGTISFPLVYVSFLSRGIRHRRETMRTPKRIVILCLSLALMALAIPFSPASGIPAFAAVTPAAVVHYTILVDSRAVTFDVAPSMRNGRIMVPFRAIAESLGIAVTWDQKTGTAHASGYGKNVSLQVGNFTAQVDGLAVRLDVAPIILDSRTLIPLRFFSEVFGCAVLWDGPALTVRISSPVRAMEVSAWYAMDGNWNGLFGSDYPVAAPGGTDAIGTVIFGWYEMNDAGMLFTTGTKGWKKPVGWADALAPVRQYGLHADFCAYMTDGNDGTGGSGPLTRMLANPYARQNAVIALVTESADYDGTNLDMEGLGFSDTGEQLTAVRQGFTDFVKLVSESLHAAGKTLTLTLHPTNGAYKGYDYAALAPLADRILLMAYDYGQKPERYQLVHEAIDSALMLVPKEKLVLGISFASETPESLTAKLGLAKQHELAGVSLWRLGLMIEGDWAALRSSVRPIR